MKGVLGFTAFDYMELNIFCESAKSSSAKITVVTTVILEWFHYEKWWRLSVCRLMFTLIFLLLRQMTALLNISCICEHYL